MIALFYCTALILSGLMTGVTPPVPYSSEPMSSTVFVPVVVSHWPLSWEWQQIESVEGIEFSRNDPQAVFDGRGRLHLFWDTNTADRSKFIYHAYRHEDGWINAYPVAQSLGASTLGSHPVLAQDGTLHLLWANEVISGTQNATRLLYANFVDDGWSQEQELYRSLRDISGWLQLDTSNQLHLYVRDRAIPMQLLNAVRTSNGWSWLDPIDLPQQVYWIWPDYADGVRMYYGQSQAETLFSRWYNGEYDPLEQSIVGLDILSRKTILDGQNSLHVFWQSIISIPGGSVYAAHHQCMQSNQILAPVEVTSGDVSASYPVASADQTGWFAIGWKAGTNLQVALWRSCSRLGVSTAPPSPDIAPSVEAVAVDSRTGQVCIITRRFLDETHDVACAYLR